MTTTTDTAERFANETAGHQMTVLHDDGLYRHIRFMNPQYSSYWFDLITWPGNLVFRGDGTTFAFSRTEDMFEFFRSGIHRDGSIHTNPDYWAQKLTTDRDSVMTYSQTIFEQQVADDLKQAEEDFPGITAAWEAKTDGFSAAYNTEYEDTAREALDDFEFGTVFKASCECGWVEEFADEYDASMRRRDHISLAAASKTRKTHNATVERLDGFRFDDTWEWRLKDFDWWFLWACHAIVWGISQYDAKRAGEASDAKAVA